jgi:hypothetical protein
MSRGKKKKRKRADRQSETTPKTIKDEIRSTVGNKAKPGTNVPRRWWKRVVTLVSILLAVGSIPGFYGFFPRVSIEPTSPLKSSNPYSARFVITNTGLLTIHDVEVFCGHPSKITRDAGATWQDLIGWDRATEAVIRALPQDGAVTATCAPPPIRIGFSDGRVVPPAPPEGFMVKVVFRPDYWPTRQTKSESFGVVFGEDGHPNWFKKPLPPNRSIPELPIR